MGFVAGSVSWSIPWISMNKGMRGEGEEGVGGICSEK